VLVLQLRSMYIIFTTHTFQDRICEDENLAQKGELNPEIHEYVHTYAKAKMLLLHFERFTFESN